MSYKIGTNPIAPNQEDAMKDVAPTLKDKGNTTTLIDTCESWLINKNVNSDIEVETNSKLLTSSKEIGKSWVFYGNKCAWAIVKSDGEDMRMFVECVSWWMTRRFSYL